jgi:hypothetical protein
MQLAARTCLNLVLLAPLSFLILVTLCLQIHYLGASLDRLGGKTPTLK